MQRRESRRARILRGALARRQRVAEKFANPLGRKTDAALFSGKRMDEEEQIEYAARPSILMMCCSLVIELRRVSMMNTIRCCMVIP